MDKIIGNQSSNVLFPTENTLPFFVNFQRRTRTYLLTQDLDALTRKGKEKALGKPRNLIL